MPLLPCLKQKDRTISNENLNVETIKTGEISKTKISSTQIVLKDSTNKWYEIANAEIEFDVLVNAKEGVLKDSNDKQQEISNAEIESEVLTNAKGVFKDSNNNEIFLSQPQHSSLHLMHR